MTDCPFPDWLATQDRFVKAEVAGKAPTEQWGQPENQYDWYHPELEAHRQQNGNVHLITGDDLIVIDLDDLDAYPEWVDELPETLTVETGGGGRHRYYRCLEEPYGQTNAFDWGEVRGGKSLVSCPGNVHPSGSTYHIIEDHEIAAIHPNRIRKEVGDDGEDVPEIDDLPSLDAEDAPDAELVAALHPWMQEYPPLGERSEFDFKVCCMMIRYGVPRDSVEQYLKSFEGSKVRERGTINYGGTWEAARREVGDEAGNRKQSLPGYGDEADDEDDQSDPPE